MESFLSVNCAIIVLEYFIFYFKNLILFYKSY